MALKKSILDEKVCKGALMKYDMLCIDGSRGRN